jgi:DNA-binding CsgD family transcriptional regulator
MNFPFQLLTPAQKLESVPVQEPLSLTPTQREVISYFARGHKALNIAAKMSISVFTVRAHARNILIRLKAHSIAHAVGIVSGFTDEKCYELTKYKAPRKKHRRVSGRTGVAS